MKKNSHTRRDSGLLEPSIAAELALKVPLVWNVCERESAESGRYRIMQSLHWFDELHTGGDKVPEREPLGATAIDELEADFRVNLPISYKDIVTVHHGDGPLQSDFVVHARTGIQKRGLGRFLEIERWQDSNVYEHAEYMINDVVPFAEDGGGNLICFDYRGKRRREDPSIAFWDHELGADDLLPVADSFEAFIDLLFVPQDIIEDLTDQGLLPEGLVR